MGSLANKAMGFAKTNGPAILAGLGVSGTVFTAYLTAKASFKAAREIDKAQPALATNKEKAQLVWKLYIPAGVSGAVTIGCIIGATGVGNRKTAAAATAYSLTERAFSEYRDKVVEQIGEHKEQGIRDKIVEEKIAISPPKDTIVIGSGKVLCCELYTGRYFECDMEKLKRSQNDINAHLLSNTYVALSEFYYRVGLPFTSHCANVGWDSDKQMALEFTTVLTEGGVPCLAFDYNYVKPL